MGLKAGSKIKSAFVYHVGKTLKRLKELLTLTLIYENWRKYNVGWELGGFTVGENRSVPSAPETEKNRRLFGSSYQGFISKGEVGSKYKLPLSILLERWSVSGMPSHDMMMLLYLLYGGSFSLQ